MAQIKCFLLTNTGRYTEWQDLGNGARTQQPIYRREDTGEELLLREAPVGAIWQATWYEGAKSLTGPDGKSYFVRTPGGDWCIDSKASNCTMPDDDDHNCWVRHGEAPNFTVDKNGHTCQAGAGSIMKGDYHGFLRNGYLED